MRGQTTMPGDASAAPRPSSRIRTGPKRNLRTAITKGPLRRASSLASPPSTEEIVDKLTQFAALGIRHYTSWLYPLSLQGIERLVPIVEAAHKL